MASAWFTQNAPPQYRMNPLQPNMGFQGPMRSLSEFSADGGTLALPQQRQSYDATVPSGFNPNAGGLTPTTPSRGNVPPAGQVPGGFNPAIDLTPAKGQTPPPGAGAPTGGAGIPPVPQRGAPEAQVRAYLKAISQAKGIPWNATSEDYWVSKFYSPEFNGDVNYWANRVGQADEFTGGGGRAGAGGFDPTAPLMRGANENFSYDPNKILDSPAFAAARDRGIQALDRSAAAKGTVLGGGQKKEIADWVAGLALNSINDDFGRSLDTSRYNRDTLWGNDDRRFSRLADFAGLGLQASWQLGGYGSQYSGATDAIAGQQSDNTTNQGNATAGAALAGGTLPRAPLQAFDARAILSPKRRAFENRGR